MAQTISQRGKEVERAAPIIRRKAIEELSKSPFRLLGNFGQQKFNCVLRIIKNIKKRPKSDKKTNDYKIESREFSTLKERL